MLFRYMLFNVYMFLDSLAVSLFLISSLIPLRSESKHCMISILFKYIKLCFLAQKVVCLGECFMWVWEKICILLLLGEVVSRCQLYTVDWWCLSSTMCLQIFCLLDLSISVRRVLKFPTMIADSSVSPLSSDSFCLI